MKRMLFLAGPIGLALMVIAAGWAVLASRTLPRVYQACFVAGLVLVLLSLWDRREVVFARGSIRKARLGAGALATSGVSLALLLLVNFAAARYPQRWDVTRDRDFSLHPATERVLQQVQRDVDVYAFVPKEDKGQTRAVRELYALFAQAQPLVRVTVADANQRPDLIEKVGVRGNVMTVVESGDRRTAFTGHEEADLAAALLEVGRDTQRIVYWVQGHGERAIDTPGGTGYIQFEKDLRASYLQVRTLTLGLGEPVPEDASLLIFNDPRRALTPAEADVFDAWLRRGHRALVLQDVDFAQVSGAPAPAAALLDRWGLRSLPAAAVDPRRRMGDADARLAVLDVFGRHPAVQALIGELAVLPLARPLEFFQAADAQIFHHALARLGGDPQGRGADPYATLDLDAVRDVPQGEVPGREAWSGKPVNVALAAFRRFEPRPGELTAGREARVVLVGDADFLNDQNIARGANRELAQNLVRWLTGEELLIRRQGELRVAKTAMRVEPWQDTILRLLTVIIPVVTFLSGWIVWGLRRVK